MGISLTMRGLLISIDWLIVIDGLFAAQIISIFLFWIGLLWPSLLASFADFPTMCSIWVGKDASNDPAVEPSLADSKPAEATEATEVPWTCGGALR